MDFAKPIYAETWRNVGTNKLKEYLNSKGIEFKERPTEIDGLENLHVFEIAMTDEQLREACRNDDCDALYYQ